MKQLLTLQQEYIIKTKFVADTVKNEKTGYYDPAWTDETKTKAPGRQNVEDIEILIPVYDREGYNTNQFQRYMIYKSDILTLAEKIKEIDAIRCEGVPGDDLPF